MAYALGSLDPYLINSIKGLRNLKQTYSLCVQTCARLDTIIAKINRNITVILETFIYTKNENTHHYNQQQN